MKCSDTIHDTSCYIEACKKPLWATAKINLAQKYKLKKNRRKARVKYGPVKTSTQNLSIVLRLVLGSSLWVEFILTDFVGV